MGNRRAGGGERGGWLGVGEKGEEGWDAERDSRAATVAGMVQEAGVAGIGLYA